MLRRSCSTTIFQLVGLHARQIAPPTGIYRNRPAMGSRVSSATAASTTRRWPSCPWIRSIRSCGSGRRNAWRVGDRPEVNHVLMFENKGDVVGVSNPHPHGQIYATNFVFKSIEVEADACGQDLAENRRPLFQDILAAEHEDGRRIIFEKDSAIAFLPYFALCLQGVPSHAGHAREHRIIEQSRTLRPRLRSQGRASFAWMTCGKCRFRT